MGVVVGVRRRKCDLKKGGGNVSHTVAPYFRVAYRVYAAAKSDLFLVNTKISFVYLSLVRYNRELNDCVKFYTII